jgi:hypothetical protein
VTRRPCWRLIVVVTLAGCSSDDESASTGSAPNNDLFTEIAARAGIDFRLENGKSDAHHIVETMIGGVGWIDYDGDGFFDLYIPNGHDSSIDAWKEGKQSNRLYRNLGNGSFEDVTEAAGVGDRRYSSGVAVADFDNDGDSDLLVTNIGRNTLYRNRGDGTFEDHTEKAGLTHQGSSSSAAWFDLDRDGDLDLFITRYLRYRPGLARRCREGDVNVYCHPRFFSGEPDLLYENRGDGTFVEIGESAGIAKADAANGKGLGVIAADLDGDGWPDLYVANDTTPNFYWHNTGKGLFENRAFDAGVALSSDGIAQAGMGVDWGDVDGDGDFDIHVTNFAGETNNLFLADGKGAFRDGIQRAKLGRSYSRLGFGTLLADLDLDGDLDIVTANGHVDDSVEDSISSAESTYRQPPDFFRGDGTGRFEHASATAGAAFEKSYVARGLASADIDNDGDLDLAMATIDGPLVLLRNNTRSSANGEGPHYLRVRLRGTKSNRDGYGARIEARIGKRTLLREYQSARSYLTAVDPRALFGLGDATKVDELIVTWPSGRVQKLKDVEGNREIVVVEE